MDYEEDVGRAPPDSQPPRPRPQAQNSAASPDIDTVVLSVTSATPAILITEQLDENNKSNSSSNAPRVTPRSQPILPYEFTIEYSTSNSGREHLMRDLDHDYRLIFPTPTPSRLSIPTWNGGIEHTDYLARYHAKGDTINLYCGPTARYPLLACARYPYTKSPSRAPTLAMVNNKHKKDEPKLLLPTHPTSFGFNESDPLFLTSIVEGKAETKKYVIKNTGGHIIRSLGWVENEMGGKGSKIVCKSSLETVAVYFGNQLYGTGKMLFLSGGRILGDQFMLGTVMKFLTKLESNRRFVPNDYDV